MSVETEIVSDARASGESGACLNCGTALVGEYCHACGQSSHIHRTLSAWWHDLAHGALHFEGAFWRTLPMLALRPGELTRRYIEGERRRFVSPIALFLFAVFLMFAVFAIVGSPVAGAPDAGVGAEQAAADLRAEREALEERIAGLEERRGGASGETAAQLEREIAAARDELRNLETARRLVAPVIPDDAEEGDTSADGGETLPPLKVTTGSGQLDAAFESTVEKARENPSLLFYKIQANAYKFSWALIPISVPFVWLLFLWRRGHRVFDHTVFVTYSIAAMTLLVVVLTALRPLGLGDGFFFVALMLVPPVHIYKQLRGAYRLSRFSALWRTLFLIVFAIIAGLLFFLLLTMLGALT